MDPVSAVGIAAAAVQFAEITIKITKRIAVFAVLRDVPGDAEGPKAFIERLRSQLGLLNTTTRRIEEGLVSSSYSFKDNELSNLRNYISNLNRHGKKLDRLLSKYLPDDSASIPAILLAALKGIASDTEIKSVMDSINELLPLLTTFLLTSIFTNNNLAFLGCDLAPTNSSLIYQVSRHEVRHFIHRPELQTEIDHIFNNKQTQLPKTAVLHGMGGQGKTQLAIRYCVKARLEKKFQYILWVDASTRASTVRGLEEISETLKDSNQTLLDSDARVLFVKRRLMAAHSSWLLVFDNYDNPSAFDLREYIPQGPLGNVLITSRSEGLERLGQVIRISGMTEDEAIQLLFTLLNTTENKTNRIAATDIVRRLGYLPLAIDQAGSYMKNGGIALADFLGYYEQSAKDVLESVPNLWEYYESAISESEKCTTNITAKTVFTTWNLSFTSLKPDTPEGALKVTFLSLLAFFNEHVISEEFFEVYYSANRLSQQPEWMSLFIDDDGLWSCRKFDGVMRSFLRLSLITSLNTDRVDTKYAFVTFHPLVRDWINLRQERSTHKANFTTFTGILASYISATFWEDSVWIYGFRISADQRRRLAGHLARWMEVFKFHKSSLQPTILAAEYEQNVTTITAEQLIAKLFYQLDQRNNSFELSQWLWESCDISDRRMVRVKFDAGNQQVLCQNTADETRNKSRELLEYWKSVLGADHSRDYMLIESHFVLIASLANSVHAVDKEECIDICKAELERLPYGEENMSLRHRILNELAYAAYWSYQRDVCKKTIEIMLDETEGRGGDNFRKKIWSQRVWEIILIIVTDRFYDLRLADRLSLVALESAKEKHGINQINVGRSYLLRARVLANMGRFVEAESLTRDCIVSGQLNRDVYILSHRVLGDILRGQGKFEEAYANYNSVLFLMQKFQVRNTTLVLLYKCGEVATAFNARLADTHYTMMLSLAKKVGDWDILVCGVTELYRVKATIGTKGAKKDALELLVEGLTVYGINFVCKSDTQRAPLRETHTTIHLGQLESSQYSAQGEMVRKALMVKFAGSSRSGINFLIWLAVELLEATDVNAAEHAFRLARYVFDKSMGFNEYEILRTMKHIFRYAKLRYAVDKDQQKVRDILDWAQTDIRKRIGHMVENREDWWESQTTPLLDLIETPAQRAKRQYSKAKKKISHRFSSIMR